MSVPKLTLDVNVQVRDAAVDCCVRPMAPSFIPGHSLLAGSIAPQQSHAHHKVFQCWKQVSHISIPVFCVAHRDAR